MATAKDEPTAASDTAAPPAQNIKVNASDYVLDPIHGIVAKDAETHRRLYEDFLNGKAHDPTGPAPLEVQQKLHGA